MQVAILAGGLATRLRPLTNRVPKSMVEIHGKPFLQYQIELLRANHIQDIVLCVGHLSGQIRSYFGDGRRYGVRITYSDEGDRRLGTGGALKFAEDLLASEFFVLFGDSYLLLDYPANDNLYDSSDVLMEDGLVIAYDKENPLPGMVHINVGLSVLRRQSLTVIPRGQSLSLQAFFRELIAQRQLLALETRQRFYEIGSLEGLHEFERLVTKWGSPS